MKSTKHNIYKKQQLAEAASLKGETVTINANTDGAGAQGFTMNAGGAITTTNASSSAVAISVNAAGGGTGGAALRGITTGSGGTITVATNTGGNSTGGSITQTAGGLLNAGTLHVRHANIGADCVASRDVAAALGAAVRGDSITGTGGRLVEPGQVAVRGEGDEAVVESQRGAAPRFEGVGPQRRARLVDRLPQRGDGGGRQPVLAPEAVALDHEPDVEDLLEVLVTHRADVGAAVGLDGEQALGREDPDRLADRRAAERQLAGQLQLVHALPGRQLAPDDGLAEVPGDLRRQRGLLERAASCHARPGMGPPPAADHRSLTIDCRLFSFPTGSGFPARPARPTHPRRVAT